MAAIETRRLHDPEITQLEGDLHSLSYWLPYRGLSFDSDSLHRYYLDRALAKVRSGNGIGVGAFSEGGLVGFQLSEGSDFLSEYFGIGCGSITLTGLAADPDRQLAIATTLSQESLAMLKEDRIEFVSASAYAEEKAAIRAFEDSGFHLVEIFANYSQEIEAVDFPSEELGFVIRDCVADDVAQVKKLYENEKFPGRLVSESRLPKDAAYALYGRRFQEVFEKRLGRIFIAEQDGKVVGALIGMIDQDLYRQTGIKTNPLSGMGIIVDRQSRGMGVSTNLISERMRWYQAEGVQAVSFGASINNVAMIGGLTKRGMKFTSALCAFHVWT